MIKHKNSEIFLYTPLYYTNTSTPNHTSHEKMTLTEIFTDRYMYLKLNLVFVQSYDMLDNEHHDNDQHSYKECNTVFK